MTYYDQGEDLRERAKEGLARYKRRDFQVAVEATAGYMTEDPDQMPLAVRDGMYSDTYSLLTITDENLFCVSQEGELLATLPLEDVVGAEVYAQDGIEGIRVSTRRDSAFVFDAGDLYWSEDAVQLIAEWAEGIDVGEPSQEDEEPVTFDSPTLHSRRSGFGTRLNPWLGPQPTRWGNAMPAPTQNEPVTAAPSPEPVVIPRTAAQPSSPASDDIAGQLERLAKLRQDGLLSDEEFAAAKNRLLGG